MSLKYMMTWRFEIDSGNGPYTATGRCVGSTFDMIEALRELQEKEAQHRHYWDHKSPKWRSKVYKPYYWNLKLEKMSPSDELDALLEMTKISYDKEYAKREARREKAISDDTERRRVAYEKLQAEFGGNDA